jgi:hypothetical protein
VDDLWLGRKLMSGALSAMVGASGGRMLTVGNYLSTVYGFNSAIPSGSLTPTEFLSTNIRQLTWSASELRLAVSDTSVTNSGWSSINVNGTTFLRTSASFASGIWVWSGVSTNPIGTGVGDVIPINIA